jgi:F-type H+-transporting ATPase subunit b
MMKRLRWVLLAVLTVVGVAWPIIYSHAQQKAPPPAATAAPAAPQDEIACDPKNAESCPESDECVATPNGNICQLKSINWASGSPLGNKQSAYLYSAINFLILIGIYWYFGRKPIAEALATRRANVAKEIEEAQRMKDEAEARAKQYQAKLASLEQELATARQALVDAGRGEKERIVKEAEEKAARMKKDAEFLIDQELKQMRQDLWRDTVALAVGTAEELLKKRITQADQERIAEDYLADLAPRRPSLTPRSGGAS